MHTVNILKHAVENHQILFYFLIFLGLIFEGEIVVISVGILAHLGALDFWFSLLFILGGALSKTFIFYALGEYLSGKFHHHRFFRYIKKRVYGVLPHFKAHPFWSVFISKFIMGINYLVVIFCGYEKINYRRFLEAEISSTLVWAPALLSLGYVFGYAALSVSREIWKFSVVVLALFLIFIFFDKLVAWAYEVFEEFHESIRRSR